MKKAIITLTFLSLCFASDKADYISDMKRKERMAKDPKFRILITKHVKKLTPTVLKIGKLVDYVTKILLN